MEIRKLIYAIAAQTRRLRLARLRMEAMLAEMSVAGDGRRRDRHVQKWIPKSS
jgi:hypothetical protein